MVDFREVLIVKGDHGYDQDFQGGTVIDAVSDSQSADGLGPGCRWGPHHCRRVHARVAGREREVQSGWSEEKKRRCLHEIVEMRW